MSDDGVKRALELLNEDVKQLFFKVSRLEKRIYVLEKKPATEKQKILINDICTTLGIAPPEGYPNRLLRRDASQFISAHSAEFYRKKQQKQPQSQPQSQKEGSQ